jgi:rod shape-determining protein MreB
MLDKLFGKFSRDLGIDLGTANTLVYVHGKGIVINKPSVVAINQRVGEILAVGRAAKEMLGKTPPHITISRPLVKGIISDFEVTEKMLKFFVDRVHEEGFTIVPRPRIMIGVPLEITEVERKAVEDAAAGAGGREVFLVEEPMAAAIGARLPIEEPLGSMIVDVGGGTTEIALISLAGIVTWRSLPVAGDELNKNIVQYARDIFNLSIGEQNAELIKMRVGSALPLDEPLEIEMRGRDLLTGLPKEIIVTDAEIREALSKSIQVIVENIKENLEATPPELVSDIYERGMVLSGGGALLRGLDKLITRETGIAVRVADDPMTCVVRGLGILLDNQELLKTVALPKATE